MAPLRCFFIVATLVSLSSRLAYAQNIVVEVLAVIDLKTWNEWNSVANEIGNSAEEEIMSVFYEVNQLYEPIGIEIRLVGDTFMKLDYEIISQADVYGDNQLDAPVATDVFQRWTESEGLSFDVAVMFITYDLVLDGDPGNGGYAYLDVGCTSMAVSIVEATYDMRMIMAVAHEMAHNLGVYHDAEGNSCRDQGYIMTPYTSPGDTNYAEWSSCSEDYFATFFAQEPTGCLEQTSSQPLSAERFGRLVSGDETCQRQFGDLSYVSRVYTAYPMCTALSCEYLLTIELGSRNSLTWWSSVQYWYPPPGMPCDEGKSCLYGECTSDSTTPGVDGDCLFGDTPWLLDAPWSSCEEAIEDGMCSNSAMADICCESC